MGRTIDPPGRGQWCWKPRPHRLRGLCSVPNWQGQLRESVWEPRTLATPPTAWGAVLGARTRHWCPAPWAAGQGLLDLEGNSQRRVVSGSGDPVTGTPQGRGQSPTQTEPRAAEASHRGGGQTGRSGDQACGEGLGRNRGVDCVSGGREVGRPQSRARVGAIAVGPGRQSLPCGGEAPLVSRGEP